MKIRAGELSAPVDVIATDDDAGAQPCTVKVVLLPGKGYTVGTPSEAKVRVLP